jgi:DNA polymerase-3 subunit delta
MTSVSSGRGDSFAANPPAGMGLFLVHGGDEGLVADRVNMLLKAGASGAGLPVEVLKLDGDQVSREPHRLLDEVYSRPLFGDAVRKIQINTQGRDISAILQQVIGDSPEGTTIVVKAGLLKKGHRLRTLFEEARNAAAIECFPDRPADLASRVDRDLRELGISLQQSARAALLRLLDGDRQGARNELAKLALYCHGLDDIGAAEIQAILGEGAQVDLDEVIEEALSRRRPAGAAQISLLGADSEAFVRRLIFRMLAAHRNGLGLDGRPGPDGAGTGPRTNVLMSLKTLQTRLRTDPALSHLLAERGLWALASRQRN